MSNFWYEGKIPKEVFKFLKNNHKCVGCGKCCHCSPIVIYPRDIKVISWFLHMTPQEFKDKYTMPYPQIPGLSCFKNVKPCVFLNKENKCDIYQVRPLICRNYPLLSGTRIPKECEVINNLMKKIITEQGTVSVESLKNGMEKLKNDII